MSINDVEEYIKKDGTSLCYSAYVTYESDFFELRTGQYISVLELGHSSSSRILLRGEIKVSSDNECWQIVMKFRNLILSQILFEIINENYKLGLRDGESKAQHKIRQALGI
jgi:hypothetical protein